MKVLVIVASKHGSTFEIGEVIAGSLGEMGVSAEIYQPQIAPDPASYDAVVIGSSVYADLWMAEAREYIKANQPQLLQMPVWLFSSGPLGSENPQPAEDPTQIDELLAQTGAVDHQIFVGKLDKEALNFAEKIIVRAVKAPYGDFRDWDAIQAWTQSIAAQLEPTAV